MLVLTRNVHGNNSLTIQTSDGEIEVLILNNKNGQVKVGINAPENVDVWRSEVFDKEVAT